MRVRKPGTAPAMTHKPARPNIALREYLSVSTASRAASRRPRPKKVTPNALTKHAAASAAESARIAPAAGATNRSPHCGRPEEHTSELLPHLNLPSPLIPLHNT